MSKAVIAIDAHGGDHGLGTTVPAVKFAVERFKTAKFILVGQEEAISASLKRNGLSGHPRVEVRHASEIVAMDESPAVALRTKKDSSMRVAINLVKEKEADACVSAGNTGALMATSRFVLKMLPGIDRPAIVYEIPSLTKNKTLEPRFMLDLGANVDCTADNLCQFALMGSVLAKTVGGVAKPRVALLNIGEEDIKGLEPIKEAAAMLQKSTVLNYTGFIEGNGIFFDKADVIVCDGFVGNVSLKTTEGIAKLIIEMLKTEFNRSFFTKLCGLIAYPVLKRLKTRLDIRQYNGASLVGLKGIVIKSHGSAKANAFTTAIQTALAEVEKSVPSLIHDELKKLEHEHS